jgi:arginine exporter protein ArgO
VTSHTAARPHDGTRSVPPELLNPLWTLMPRAENRPAAAEKASRTAVRPPRIVDRDRPSPAHASRHRGGGRASTAGVRRGRRERVAAVVTAALAAGLLAGYGVAVPVGAIAALIVSLTARTSLRVGAAAALGVASADGLYAVAAVVGGAALARVIAPVSTPLRWTAAVVLVGLALRTAVSAIRHHREGAAPRPATGLATPARAYLGLLGLTLLNPATIVYFGALVLGRQAGGEVGGIDAGLFVAGAFLASASWQLLLAGGGSLVGRVLTGPRGRLATALVSSAVIAVLAAALVMTR